MRVPKNIVDAVCIEIGVNDLREKISFFVHFLAFSLELRNPLLACVGYAFLGAVVGVVSLFLFPHPLVHRSRIPGVSLIAGPMLAGFGMSFVGSFRRRRNQRVIQIESFAYGFAFAFGMAIVRFFLTTNAQ